MLAEALAGLAVHAGGIYVDGTYGRGGHSGAILDALNGSGMLHALDRDPAATAEAWKRHGTLANFRIHARNFAEIGALAAELGLNGRVAGLLLDLGVSSPQFDDAARGFSFANDGPLDMRMDPHSGESAAQWLARAKDEEIADVLWRFGDERNSRRIARRIVDSRGETPITSTAQLAALIAAVPGPRSHKIHPATRSFQAIRIHINGELAALKAKERLTDASLKAAIQTTRRRGFIEWPAAIAKHLDVEAIDCLDAKTGKLIWRHAYPTTYEDPYGYNNGPRGAPLLTKDRCYTFGAEGV
ncbi:MAG: 16S rRNA (cytosine(1402)-N(4))-methyltransferase RsmH, partial [Nevskia sp.]|nr:16S rRNA (cytosine(1402)-N(4))-methyltransferase RsmH [Nevskia sp.]